MDVDGIRVAVLSLFCYNYSMGFVGQSIRYLMWMCVEAFQCSVYPMVRESRAIPNWKGKKKVLWSMQRIQLPEYELYLIIFQCIINMYQQYIFQNVFSVLYLNIVHSSPFDRGIWKSPSLFFFLAATARTFSRVRCPGLSEHLLNKSPIPIFHNFFFYFPPSISILFSFCFSDTSISLSH